MRREFLTPSNILSIARAVLAIPFALVMLSSIPTARIWGAVILVVAGLTDRYDGILARKYGYETEWGRILDPLADKIAVAVGALVLLVLGDLPLWFIIALLARDILILLGGLIIKKRKGRVLPSNQPGKWAVGIISLTFFVLILGGPSVPATVLMWIGTGLLVWSFGTYLLRFWQVMKQAA